MSKPFRVVCVGDSVVFGEHVPSDQRWTTYLAQRHPAWNVLNRGVNGDTTRLGLERFPMDVQAARPDVVVIQFGHNDANSFESDGGKLNRVLLEAYEWNLVEMAERAIAFDARAVVVLTPYPVTSKGEAYEKDVRAFAHGARCAAQQHTITLCDLAEAWPAEPDMLLLEDGLHPSPTGHRWIARQVSNTIQGLAL